MSKRHLFVLPLLCLCAGGVFALETKIAKKSSGGAPKFSVSAGGRMFYNGMFDVWRYEFYGSNKLQDRLHNNHGFGIGVFLDATYIEIGGGVIFGSFKPNYSGYVGDFELTSTQFDFMLLGKYPVSVGATTVFPLLGINIQTFLSGESNGQTIGRSDMPGDFQDLYDAFNIVAGAGLDYNISEKLYVRAEALVNFKTESGSDKALKKLAMQNGGITFDLFTFGPRASVGLGYKF